MLNFFDFCNPDFVRDGVNSGDADGVAQELVSVLDRNVLYVDGILASVGHAILIDIDGVVLLTGHVDGVFGDSLNGLGCNLGAATGAAHKEGETTENQN